MTVRRLVPAAVAALFLVPAPQALAERPRFFSGPDIDILVGQTQRIDTPPAVPKVGDTLYGNNGSPDCNPACDPAKDNRTDHDTLINPADGPSGQFYSWARCNNSGCTTVQPKSTDGVTYRVKPEDANSKLQLTVWLVNYDCAEERTTDKYRECRYATTTANALTETVAPNVVVAVGPDALPAAAAGAPYAQALTATGGSGPYTFTLASGTLPAGVTLSPAGRLSGTPTQGGTYSFTVRAAGSGADPGTRAYTLIVRLALPPAVANGVTGVPYTQPLTGLVGATGAVTYTLAAGALPDGLAISGSALVGTPTRQGTFRFTLQASDAGTGATGTKEYVLQIAYPRLTLLPTALPEVVRGVPYSAVLSATGGTGPYTWTLLAGELPLGLRLRANGELAGRSLEPFSSAGTIVLGVRDRYGAPATIALTLRVWGPTLELVRAEHALVAGTKTKLRLRALGGKGPYTFTLLKGRLPTGLVLTEAGVVQGTPSAAGRFVATLLVTDAKGVAERLALDVVVV